MVTLKNEIVDARGARRVRVRSDRVTCQRSAARSGDHGRPQQLLRSPGQILPARSIFVNCSQKEKPLTISAGVRNRDHFGLGTCTWITIDGVKIVTAGAGGSVTTGAGGNTRRKRYGSTTKNQMTTIRKVIISIASLLVLVGFPCREQLARLDPPGLARLAIRVKGVGYCAHRLKVQIAREKVKQFRA
jgi:hypothetical protein